jgi:hypothetical protein
MVERRELLGALLASSVAACAPKRHRLVGTSSVSENGLEIIEAP